jgi:ATP-dependent 26S proteasome regulatory subunit
MFIQRPHTFSTTALSRLQKMAQPPVSASAQEAPEPTDSLEDKLDKAIKDALPEIKDAVGSVTDLTKGKDLTLRENKGISGSIGAFGEGVRELGNSVHPFKSQKEMVEAWLGATEFHRFAESRNPAPMLPGLKLKAVQEVCKNDYTIVHTVAPADWQGRAQAPKYTPIRTDYDTTETLPLSVTYLLEDKDKNHLMVELNGGRLRVIGHNDQKELVSDFYDKVETHTQENNFYKNKILQFSGGVLDFQTGLKKSSVTWDDIALPEASESLIKSNTVDFLKNLEAYKKNGKFASRNLLMAGPPGTGKSMVNDILMQQLEGEATFIHVTSKSLGGPQSVSGVFEAAREMQPAVVILEDLDMLGATGRNDSARRGTLNELLNQISGVFDNEGIVVMGSTNAASKFDHAMLRPLRFSNVIPVPMPDADIRKKILTKVTRKLHLAADVNLEDIAARTDKYTGAGLTELKELAIQSAISDKSFAEGNKVLLRKADFEEALETVRLKNEYLEQIRRDERDAGHGPKAS